MLDKIRAIALEKLGSEEAADAFMAGFQKEAMDKAAAFSNIAGAVGAAGWNHPLVKPALGLGASLIGAAIVKGVASGSHAYENSNMRGKFELALQQVTASNRIIKQYRPEKVKEFAETMFKFAPHIASDPNILGMLLANSLQSDLIDVKTIETLVNLEGRYKDNNKTNPLPGIRT